MSQDNGKLPFRLGGLPLRQVPVRRTGRWPVPDLHARRAPEQAGGPSLRRLAWAWALVVALAGTASLLIFFSEPQGAKAESLAMTMEGSGGCTPACSYSAGSSFTVLISAP